MSKKLELTPEFLENMRKIIVMAQGGNPEAQQTLNEFMKFANNIERTNLPNRKDVQMVAYLHYAGMVLFPETNEDPFTKAADSISIAFMAKGGEKSKQFVDLFKQTPSLADLQMIQEKPEGIMNRVLGRGKTE